MPWNSTWPIGNISVKANRTAGNQNTTYIEQTMGNSIVGTNGADTRDHFWDVDGTLDGRHRFIKSPGFTVGGNPDDPVIGTAMDAVLYAKETPQGTVEWFSRNVQGIYQAVPAVITGVIGLIGIYVTISPIPANCYGEIFMYQNTQGQFTTQWGWFRSGAALVEGWSAEFRSQSAGDSSCSVKLGNGSDAIGLNLRGRAADASAATWNYIITYRSL